MSNSGRMIASQQQKFVNQSKILRKNLHEWDCILRSQQGEDWPSMVGRLNAAMNQLVNLDRSIDPSLDHFVYQPRKSPVNAQDIPFFLSTRLVDDRGGASIEDGAEEEEEGEGVEQANAGGTGSKKRSADDMDIDDDNNQDYTTTGFGKRKKRMEGMNPITTLRNYEALTAGFANAFEENVVRF